MRCTLVWSILLSFMMVGCSTPGSKSTDASESSQNKRYLTEDRRTVRIGPSTPSRGGRDFQNPHLTRCWIADGFDFKGFDVLYLAPVETAVTPTKTNEIAMLALAQSRFLSELNRRISGRGLFPRVVTRQEEIPPGAKVLRFFNIITGFKRGSGAARFWAGEFGAGQPFIQVDGRMTDGAKDLFTYQGRRHGDSAAARLDPGWAKEESLQILDIEDLATDLTDFIFVIGGTFPEKP